MIEQLKPVVSLFKIFIEGLNGAKKLIKGSQKRDIYRKIIEFHLTLVSIIEKAEEVLSCATKVIQEQKTDQETIEKLTSMVRSQRMRLRMLIEHIEDEPTGNILKLFAPELVQAIKLLVQRKMSALTRLVFEFSGRSTRISFQDSELVMITEPLFVEWDHDRFAELGKKYLREIDKRPRTEKYSVKDRLDQQAEVLDELKKCSVELSKFIQDNMDVNELLFLAPKAKVT
jgi:hypothetical protein